MRAPSGETCADISVKDVRTRAVGSPPPAGSIMISMSVLGSCSENTRRLPSGIQLPRTFELLVAYSTCGSLPPPTGATHRSIIPLGAHMNAIRTPSGDHAGLAYGPACCVRRTMRLDSGSRTQMLLFNVEAESDCM